MNLVYSIDEIVLVHLATYKREDRSNDLVCRKEKKSSNCCCELFFYSSCSKGMPEMKFKSL